MEKNHYTYNGAESYCYPGTNVLRNKLNIKNEKALAKAEREALLTADIDAFNGNYEKPSAILDKAIITE